MYWADTITENIKTLYKDKIKEGVLLIIRDEKTASGRVHVGSLRGVAIHGIISEILNDKGVPNKFIYEINDFDPMDGIPVYLDQEKYKEHFGKPLCDIPSPDGIAKNFAEYFGQEFEKVILGLGFKPEFTRSSLLYKEGKYNECIKIALDNAEAIRSIYKEVSGSQKGPEWFPLNVRCESCGNIMSTLIDSWDGDNVEYECLINNESRKACGFKGKISPYNGNAKLPWKVEWAAKFKIYNVDVEGAGKDHSTKGGARQVAEAISRKVFKHEPPFDVPYEFFLVGGKKMSSSKGAGSSAGEMADLLPSHILRFLLLSKDYKQQINVDPEGDSVPILFDNYDRVAKEYWEGGESLLFKSVHVTYPQGLEKRQLPRFSTVAYLVQMPHVDIVKELEKLDGVSYTEKDKEELELRSKYARIWLDTYAPEDYKFEIKKELPASAKDFSDLQKKALSEVVSFLETEKDLDGQKFHTKLHEIKTSLQIEPKEFFSAIYISILGKESGPKAGWFLSVLPKDFLIKRFKEVT